MRKSLLAFVCCCDHLNFQLLFCRKQRRKFFFLWRECVEIKLAFARYVAVWTWGFLALRAWSLQLHLLTVCFVRFVLRRVVLLLSEFTLDSEVVSVRMHHLDFLQNRAPASYSELENNPSRALDQTVIEFHKQQKKRQKASIAESPEGSAVLV